MFDIQAIENLIGYYFKDSALLERAFTHSSFGNENNTDNNERLEFLGDSVLSFVVAEYLYALGAMDEGDLTKHRASMVSVQPLSNITLSLGLDKYIKVCSKFNLSPSVLCDLLEAVIAAIYLDGGIIPAKKFIKTKILKPILSGNLCAAQANSLGNAEFTDYKSKLIEYSIQKGDDLEFILDNISGEQHCPEFTYSVVYNGNRVATSVGGTKKSAQQQASKQALIYLNIIPN